MGGGATGREDTADFFDSIDGPEEILGSDFPECLGGEMNLPSADRNGGFTFFLGGDGGSGNVFGGRPRFLPATLRELEPPVEFLGGRPRRRRTSSSLGRFTFREGVNGGSIFGGAEEGRTGLDGEEGGRPTFLFGAGGSVAVTIVTFDLEAEQEGQYHFAMFGIDFSGGSRQ